jgi:hypothetical protein
MKHGYEYIYKKNYKYIKKMKTHYKCEEGELTSFLNNKLIFDDYWLNKIYKMVGFKFKLNESHKDNKTLIVKNKSVYRLDILMNIACVVQMTVNNFENDLKVIISYIVNTIKNSGINYKIVNNIGFKIAVYHFSYCQQENKLFSQHVQYNAKKTLIGDSLRGNFTEKLIFLQFDESFNIVNHKNTNELQNNHFLSENNQEKFTFKPINHNNNQKDKKFIFGSTTPTFNNQENKGLESTAPTFNNQENKKFVFGSIAPTFNNPENKEFKFESTAPTFNNPENKEFKFESTAPTYNNQENKGFKFESTSSSNNQYDWTFGKTKPTPNNQENKKFVFGSTPTFNNQENKKFVFGSSVVNNTHNKSFLNQTLPSSDDEDKNYIPSNDISNLFGK